MFNPATQKAGMDGRLVVIGLLLVFAGLYVSVYFVTQGITPPG